MKLPELNVELITNLVTWAYADHNKIEELLERFPDWGSWNQETWAYKLRNGICQTAYCMAGQAVAQSGRWRFEYYFDDEYAIDSMGNEVRTGRKEAYSDFCYPARKNGKDAQGNQRYRRVGDSEHVSDVARDLIGLTHFEADWFFDGSNNWEEIVRYAALFAKARDVELQFPEEILNNVYYYWYARHLDIYIKDCYGNYYAQYKDTIAN